MTERNPVRQRVKKGIAAGCVHGRKGGRPHLMVPERLHFAQRLMADRKPSIFATCRELGGLPASTLHHDLHTGGALKALGMRLLRAAPAKGPQRDSMAAQRP